MKRKVCFLAICLSLLVCGSVVYAKATEYKLKNVGIKISFSDEYYVFTRSTKADDPDFSQLGISGQALLDIMLENDMYLDACPKNSIKTILYEITVTMKPVEIEDYSNLDKETLTAIATGIKENFDKGGRPVSDYGLFKHSQTTFIRFKYVINESGNSTYHLAYSTAIDKKQIMIALISYDGEISASRQKEIETIVKSIDFYKQSSSLSSESKDTGDNYSPIISQEDARRASRISFLKSIPAALLGLGLVTLISKAIAKHKNKASEETENSNNNENKTETEITTVDVSTNQSNNFEIKKQEQLAVEKAEEKPLEETVFNDITVDANVKPKVKFCRKCGRELLADSVFCNYCGTKLVTDTEVFEDRSDESLKQPEQKYADCFKNHYKSALSLCEKKVFNEQYKEELLPALFVISDYAALSAKKDRAAIAKEIRGVIDGLFTKAFNETTFKQRVSLYGEVIRGRKLRAEWQFGNASLLEKDAITRVSGLLGDILLNPGCAENYDDAPIVMWGLQDVMLFSREVMMPMMKELTDLFKDIYDLT